MKEQYIGSLFHTGTYPSIHVNASDANSWRSYRGRWRLYCIFCLLLLLTFFWVTSAFAEASYPDLRDAHDPELQKAMNKALGPSHTEFWSGVHKKEFGFVVVDVTDLHNPKVAWYNPNLMLYAASLPKIAIVLGVFVEIERGVIKLDSETRNQLIRMIRHPDRGRCDVEVRESNPVRSKPTQQEKPLKLDQYLNLYTAS